EQNLQRRLEPPSHESLLGRDELGRDMLARVVHGGRYTLGVAVVAVALGGTIGTLAGLISGYFGGRIDSVIMRAVDVMLAFPSLLLALAIVSVLGTGLLNLILAIAVYTVPQ